MAHNSHGRVPGHCLRHACQLIWSPPIVAIQESDNLALTLRDTRVERRRLSAILLTQQTYVRLEFLNNFRCAVRRAVVHNNDFAVGSRKIMLQHAHNRLLNESLVVISVDQNAGKYLRQASSSKFTMPNFLAKPLTLRIALPDLCRK